jgi:WD40 repeat protein
MVLIPDPAQVIKASPQVNSDFTCFNSIAGGTDGCVRVWDNEGTPITGYHLNPDCINGVALHPTRPLLATASGQRQFSCKMEEEEDGDDSWSDNSLRIWQFPSANRTLTS